MSWRGTYRRRSRSKKSQQAIDFRLMFALGSICAQMATILALYPAFTRAWLPNQCGRYRRHWFVWNGVLSPKFVQPDCTATTNRIQVGEMLLHEAVEAYKKEGPKFMQRLLANQKTSA